MLHERARCRTCRNKVWFDASLLLAPAQSFIHTVSDHDVNLEVVLNLNLNPRANVPSVATVKHAYSGKMRPLTEEETKQVFEKLYKFIGKNIKNLIDRADEPYCFRLQKNRVYYVRESLMKKSTNVARDKLVALGTSIGKLTHTGKFRLTVGALDLLSQYAKHKIWVKPSTEMQFLYGNHVLKSGLGRITENTPAYTGVVVYSMADVPLGFGVTAKSTNECRELDPSSVVAFHQADAGEYLRAEDDM